MTDTYTKRDIAERMGVSVDAVTKWRVLGKIPSPCRLDDYQLIWDAQAVEEIAAKGPQAPGTYDIIRYERTKRSDHIQLKAGHLTIPIRERTPPGETPSQTVRWIVEQYLEYMANLDALGDEHAPSINELGIYAHKMRERDVARRERQR